MSLRLPLSLATFNSVITRSYAIGFVCMCRERFIDQQINIISQFQTSAIKRVPELTARVLLPTRLPHFRQTARSPPAKTCFFLCFPFILSAFFQDTIVFLRIPPTFFCGYDKMKFCSCVMRTTFKFVSWSVRKYSSELMRRHELGLNSSPRPSSNTKHQHQPLIDSSAPSMYCSTMLKVADCYLLHPFLASHLPFLLRTTSN